MGIVDFILNLVGLWLWLNWRSIRFAAAALPVATPLLSTLKRAEPAPARRWAYLAGLGFLLLFRAVLYRQVGSALDWTPHLNLEVITLPFRSDSPGRMLLFSLFSFGLWLGVLYLWLLALSWLNRHVPDTDLIQRLVRLHLGWIERWPALLKLALPPVTALLLWLGLAPLWVELGILPPTRSAWHTLQQAGVLAATTFLAWKYLLATVLLLHMLASYIYLGRAPIWNFVTSTTRNLLAPLGWVPLQMGRFDFAPVLGLGLVWGLSAAAERGLTLLYARLPF